MFALGNVEVVMINDKTMPVSSVFMYVLKEKDPSYQAMLPQPATAFPSSRGLSRECATQLTEPFGAIPSFQRAVATGQAHSTLNETGFEHYRKFRPTIVVGCYMKERVEGRQNSFSLFSFVSCRETSTGREAGAFPRKDNCHISLLAYSLALEENINYQYIHTQ